MLVYGQALKLPIDENSPVQPATSPYGSTKQIGEQIIKDCCQVNKDFKSIILRYFNPVGAHPTSKIGEYPKGIPQNLVPFLTQAVIGKRLTLEVYGKDYNTPDGTCIRDYIHVMDLAEAHLLALESLAINQTSNIFNIGSNNGFSVNEIIQVAEEVSKKKIPIVIGPKRKGDPSKLVADNKKISQELNWTPQYSDLKTIISTAWNWERQLTKSNS